MSQQKAQLVSPIETFTPPGMNVTGVVTATSFVGSGGTVTALASGTNLNVGVLTATEYYGSGSGLTGVAAAGYVGQTTAAQSGTTTIDLSAGNVVYFTQDTDTTVAFANTSSVQEVRFIRVKDDTATERTITWPDSIIWNGGTAPTLINSDQDGDAQIFNLTTRDQGVTWYGYEEFSYSPTELVVIGPYSVWTFGYNNQGQLGLNEGTTVYRSSPTQIPGTQWALIDGGSNTSLGTKTDETLWIWGWNGNGHLGQNDIVDRSSPTQIPGTNWSKAIFSQGCAGGTKTDGTLWMWGDAGTGKLGLNDTAQRSSPHQIPGTQWNNIYFDHSQGSNFGTKNDGTLWGWGYNYKGELGQNNIIHRSSPTQIPGTQWNWSGDSGINKFSSGTQNDAFGIKTDRTLWAWGEGLNLGRLGLNDEVGRSSPVQIPGTQWNTVSAGDATLATKTDGTLWSWGYSGHGVTGFGDTVPRSSPTQIPGTQWNNAEVNNYFSLATKTDGTLWAWGGASIPFPSPWNNPNVNYSSPIQLPGTDWASLGNTLGHNHGFMMKSL